MRFLAQSKPAAPGGDPKRVTIFGQSSGGEYTAVLMTSPLARGLFGWAILPSRLTARQMSRITRNAYSYEVTWAYPNARDPELLADHGIELTLLFDSPRTTDTDAPLFRLPVNPNQRNGLRLACRLVADEITTVSNAKVGARIGRLDDEDIVRLNAAVIVFLGLAISPRASER